MRSDVCSKISASWSRDQIQNGSKFHEGATIYGNDIGFSQIGQHSCCQSHRERSHSTHAPSMARSTSDSATPVTKGPWQTGLYACLHFWWWLFCQLRSQEKTASRSWPISNRANEIIHQSWPTASSTHMEIIAVTFCLCQAENYLQQNSPIFKKFPPFGPILEQGIRTGGVTLLKAD